MDVKGLLPALIIIPLFLIISMTLYSGVDDSATETKTDTFTVTSFDTWLILDKQYIKEYSEVVKNQSGATLVRDIDYEMSYNSGTIKFCEGSC